MKIKFQNQETLFLLILVFSFILNWFFMWHKVGVSFLVFSILWIAGFEFIKFVQLKNFQLTKFHIFIVPILFFSSVFIFRVNYFTLFLAAAIYWINSFLYVFLTTNPNFLQKINDTEILKMLARVLISVGNIFALPQANKKFESKLAKKILLATIITIPIISIVTLLLISADTVFSNFVQSIKVAIIPDFNILNIFNFLLALIICFTAISYVIGFINYANKGIIRNVNGSKSFVDLIIPAVLTYSLNIIYLIFVYIQFKYLFGGHDFAVSQGVVYSEYAIKGFWEMIAVCFINFGILYLLITKFSLSSRKSKLLLIPSYLVMIFSSVIMVISSHIRLNLYESGYGYTIDRVIPHVFLIFVILIIALLAISLYYKDSFRNKILLLGTFVIVNLFIAGFTLFPMERFIVTQNINKFKDSEKLDKTYLFANLGLEGFNEVLNQIKTGTLSAQHLNMKFNQSLFEQEGYAEPSMQYYYFENKVLDYKKIPTHSWQSWNLEYERYKQLSRELTGREFCKADKTSCDMIN